MIIIGYLDVLEIDMKSVKLTCICSFAPLSLKTCLKSPCVRCDMINKKGEKEGKGLGLFELRKEELIGDTWDN